MHFARIFKAAAHSNVIESLRSFTAVPSAFEQSGTLFRPQRSCVGAVPDTRSSLGEGRLMPSVFPSPFTWAGYLLGFGLGGFFDGILLHQILQWHHLLSLVDGVGDLRNQVIFDGLFHALMYVIAFLGVTLLIRSRSSLNVSGGTRWLFGSMLLGFGAWHVADSVLSHWILGIHRIKIDSPNPLFWDLSWFVLFAVGPIVGGLVLRKAKGQGGKRGRSAALLSGIITLIVAAGIWAAKPPADASSGVAVFRPGMSDGAIMNAITASDGKLLWHSRGIWAVKWSRENRSETLYREGALLVSNGLIGAGCLAWSQA